MAAQRGAPFAARLVAWQWVHGRHDLPWQRTRDPYRVWLSEIMLQQTQVAAALPYYERFLARFPDVRTLAAATRDDVLAHWSGLGYYRRAHHLHEAARAVVEHHQGAFPADPQALAALPGIGRSTAAAIATFAFGTRAAILDGNVKRVLARHRGIDGFPGAPAVERQLWQAAEALLPDADVEAYTQGLMDLGATVCVRASPRCLLCPVAGDCLARREGRIDALPAPRPARAVPRRDVQLLVCEREGRLLLERRPARGVWAGLWSLPELPLGEDAAAFVQASLGVRPARSEAMAPVEHAFTHFTLTMHPVRLPLVDAPDHAPAERRWFGREDALGLGLPAPVRRLIAGLDAPVAGPAVAPRRQRGGAGTRGTPAAHGRSAGGRRSSASG
ncbi:MAG: A/G-specific adenine glycosylase [Betaproteobacteria bacterium]|nr:MAG: A/G-specific adenine glycosylase [Betaproteobacteria bacterium]